MERDHRSEEAWRKSYEGFRARHLLARMVKKRRLYLPFALSLSIYLSISLGRGRLRKIGVGIELGERQYVFCTVKPPHHPRSFLAPPLHNPHTVTKERGNAGRDETNARTIISVGVGDVGKETGNGEERCSVEESSIAKLKNVGKVSQNRK